MHWAQKRAESRGIHNLGLPEQYTVLWFGKRGMHWGELLSAVQREMLFRQIPAMILVHLGGNDIETCNVGKFVKLICKNFKYLISVFNQTQIIWSDILPRVCWEGIPSLTKKRKRINRAGHGAVRKHNLGTIISHDIDGSNSELFRTDGVHLSDKGNDIFLDCLSHSLTAVCENSN